MEEIGKYNVRGKKPQYASKLHPICNYQIASEFTLPKN